MDKLSDADVFIIETLAIYSVMDLLEQSKAIDREMMNSYYERLSDIQKQIVVRFIEEKTARTQSFTKVMGKTKGGQNDD